MNGLCKNGNLDKAFELKDKMMKNGVKPSLITYSVLINGFMKSGKYDEANSVLDEMLEGVFLSQMRLCITH